jgi:hypothetical protein
MLQRDLFNPWQLTNKEKEMNFWIENNDFLFTSSCVPTTFSLSLSLSFPELLYILAEPSTRHFCFGQRIIFMSIPDYTVMLCVCWAKVQLIDRKKKRKKNAIVGFLSEWNHKNVYSCFIVYDICCVYYIALLVARGCYQ